MAPRSNRRAIAPEEKATRVPTAATPKSRDENLHWEKNLDWTWKAINHLIEHPSLRIKLFSNSTTQAKSEGRKKVSNGEGKNVLYQQLATAIFEDDSAHGTDFASNPTKFGKSTQQHFVRLKKTYSSYRLQFKGTGGGVLEGEAYKNLFEKICKEWEFFQDLHNFWRELPNYNPVGVSTSEPGQNHAEKAAQLFLSKSSSPPPYYADSQAGSGGEEEIYQGHPIEEEGGRRSVSSGWEGDKEGGDDGPLAQALADGDDDDDVPPVGRLGLASRSSQGPGANSKGPTMQEPASTLPKHKKPEPTANSKASKLRASSDSANPSKKRSTAEAFEETHAAEVAELGLHTFCIPIVTRAFPRLERTSIVERIG